MSVLPYKKRKPEDDLSYMLQHDPNRWRWADTADSLRHEWLAGQLRRQHFWNEGAESKARRLACVQRYSGLPQDPRLQFFPASQRTLSDSINEPPLPIISGLPLGLDLGLIHLHRDPSNRAKERRLQSAAQGHYFIALDLDECSVVGSDTNDILRTAISAMHFHESKPEPSQDYVQNAGRVFEQLCVDVVNPSMVQAIAEITAKVGYQPYILAYTNKGSVEKNIHSYMGAMQTLVNRVLLDPNIDELEKRDIKEEYESTWKHHMKSEGPNGQWVFLEGSSVDKGVDYVFRVLKEQTMPRISAYVQRSSISNHGSHERVVREELKKLSAATWGMSRALGLDYNIPVVVSNLQYKDLDTIVGVLGLPNKDKLYLFDDLAEKHYSKMIEAGKRQGERPEDAHMIPVPKFQSTCFFPTTRLDIQRKLQQLDPNYEAIKANRSLRMEISQASNLWPESSLLWDLQNERYRMGGRLGLWPQCGSVPPIPWDTSVFTQTGHAVHLGGRPRTANLFHFFGY